MCWGLGGGGGIEENEMERDLMYLFLCLLS